MWCRFFVCNKVINYLSKLVISNAIAKAMTERSRRTGISQDTLKRGKFNIGSRCVQDDVEPLKPLILLTFLMAVQYGQDVFDLRIYKNRK